MDKIDKHNTKHQESIQNGIRSLQISLIRDEFLVCQSIFSLPLWEKTPMFGAFRPSNQKSELLDLLMMRSQVVCL
jgi:hypothetical protein